MPVPAATATTPVRPALEPGPALGDLLAHVGDVEVGDVAGARRTARPPPPGSSVWTWTLRVASSPTTSTESPSSSSRGTNSRPARPAAGDDEVGAVADSGCPRGGAG